MTDAFAHIYMPYCLQQRPDGRYAVLNRRYKPLGFLTKGYVDYEAFPVLTKLRMTPKLAAVLSCKAKPDVDQIFLYSDSSNPLKSAAHMKAYQLRLALLMKAKVSNE